MFVWTTHPLPETKSVSERLHRKLRQSELELSIEASQTKDIKLSRSAHLLYLLAASLESSRQISRQSRHFYSGFSA